HIALLALPRARVLGRVRSQTPALADPVRRLLVDEVGDPTVHRPVAGGVDDEVGRQLGPVVEHHGVLAQTVDLSLGELDLPISDELGWADVDAVAGAAAQEPRAHSRLTIHEA